MDLHLHLLTPPLVDTSKRPQYCSSPRYEAIYEAAVIDVQTLYNVDIISLYLQEAKEFYFPRYDVIYEPAVIDVHTLLNVISIHNVDPNYVHNFTEAFKFNSPDFLLEFLQFSNAIYIFIFVQTSFWCLHPASMFFQ